MRNLMEKGFAVHPGCSMWTGPCLLYWELGKQKKKRVTNCCMCRFENVDFCNPDPVVFFIKLQPKQNSVKDAHWGSEKNDYKSTAKH